jgi:N-acyl-D-amino-acid deacylase
MSACRRPSTSRRFPVVLAAVALSVACGRTPHAPTLSAGAPAGQARPFDVVIANGRVVDGTGAPWFRADVGITGDRIAAIGNLSSAPALARIDAAGQVVAPGFIDLLGQSEFNVLVDSRAASKITQGITTEITGEGASIAPVTDAMKAGRKASYDFFKIAQDWRTLDEYFARLTTSGSAINIGTFVGSGGLRDYVVGQEDRVATADEMARMKALVAEAMAQGALGLSSSLQYVPNRFSTTDELVELAKVAAAHGGIYITHQRSEGNKVLESLDEVLAIAGRADIPTEIWHLKTAYKANWGKMTEVLRRIEAARARGLRVSANIYPYDRASNGLDACLPVWVREGGTDAMLQRLRDPETRARVKRDMDDPNAPYENQWFGSGGPAGVMLSSVLDPALRKYEGLSFDAIGTAMDKDPRDAAIDLVIADKAESSVIISIMRESDVVEAMRTPWVSFDTDSGARAEDGPLSASKSHPRAWGTFTRILGKYVRQDGVLTLEEAVRKMTSQAAIRVGITDRGLVRPGMMADLVVFDPATVADRATFEQPNRYSVGIRHVFVNGKAVVAHGAITTERPGRALRGPGYRPGVGAAGRASRTPDPQETIVVFETEMGTIELAVDGAHAPITAANFLRYVDGGLFDGGTVNRAVRPDNTVRHDVEIQVIQFQVDEARSRQELPPIPLERTSVTGLKHVDGAISMARGGPDTATGLFSIVIGDQPEMDFGGRRNPDGQGFAAFGRVVRGMAVVKAIQASPTGTTGPYGTESLSPPITIRKAHRQAR